MNCIIVIKITSKLTLFFKFLICVCIFVVFSTTLVESYIGVDWGRMASQRMIPSMVVDMLLQNGLHHVKLFTSSRNVLESFAGTDIELTITIPNDDLKNFTSVEKVRAYLNNKVAPNIEDNVKIRYISVGSEPFSTTSFNKTYYFALDVLKYLQIALKEEKFASLGIKATMSHFTDLLVETTKPSEGEFRPLVKEYVTHACQLLQEDNAPVWLDISPISNAKLLFNNDLEFAFFDNNSTSVFKDGDLQYNNVFEVMYDTFICALGKVGISNLTIFAGQVGWPTDGVEGANLANAHRFHKGFIQHILEGKGTPLHPGPINAYIYNLADESKLNTLRGNFIRHWGIYRFDGNPKYNIDFSGQGREIKIATLKGIPRMPKRWCIFNNATTDMAEIMAQYDFACNASDCTTMSPGGSCSHLKFPHNISYAFNIYFQSRSQKISDLACNFEGLGVIVPVDPSTESCSFPVEILSSEYANRNGPRPSNAIKHVLDSRISFYLSLLSAFLLHMQLQF